MKLSIIVSIFFLVNSFWSQNLVPNPSFEFVTNCPVGWGGILNTQDWLLYSNSSVDAFNTCTSHLYSGAPSTIRGYQQPRTGNAFAGFGYGIALIGFLNTTASVERLQVKLLNPLTAGKRYEVEFYWNLSDTSTHYGSHIGAYFSNTQVNLNSATPNLIPQVSINNASLNDTTNWVQFKQSFIAQGGEEYMVIGYLDYLNNPILGGHTGVAQGYISIAGMGDAFYYIDDVSVTEASCFEIEKILVDACGTPEGENEMVTFRIGGQDLNVSDLNVNWPSNTYGGIIQNSQTAQQVAAINSTIIGCGHLLEPTGGILPAGSEVLLITSYNFDPTAHSFTNLNDTLVVIFQNATSTGGHFANYNSSGGTRTLTMSFSNPSDCSGVVSYERDQLVNQNGTTGGNSAIKDGAFVSFTPEGIASYGNLGCQVPGDILSIDITSSINTVCGGESINLTANVNGVYHNLIWSSSEGVFSSQGNLTTVMTVNNSVSNSFYIYGSVETSCNVSIYDSILIVKNTMPNVLISASDDTLCTGQSIVLTASGASSYTWNGGVSNANPFTITSGGTYTVVGTTVCGTDTEAIIIDEMTAPAPIIVASPLLSCDSNELHTVDLTSNVCESCTYVWSDGTVGEIYSGNDPNFSVSIQNYCGTEVVNYNYTIEILDVSISTSSYTLCTGQNDTLTVSGASSYVWNGGVSTVNPLIISSGGEYTVIGTSVCGTDTATIFINELAPPDNNPILDGTVCDTNEVHSINVLNHLFVPCVGCTYLWNNGTVGPMITTSDQIFSVEMTNSCGVGIYQFGYDYIGLNGVIGVSDSIGDSPFSPVFSNLSSGWINAVSWDFDNGNTSSAENPTETFILPGEYNVALTISNPFCSNTVYQTIIVNGALPTGAIIPNIFTPNGDGENDVFSIKSINGVDLTGAIYNRWGKKVQDFNGLNTVWTGKESNEGTYYYVFEIKFLDDSKKKFKGHVQLIK